MPKTITWRELVSQFGPTQRIPPYGECVKIPGERFDPDWEALLGDEYAVSYVEIEHEKVVLVYKHEDPEADDDAKEEKPGVLAEDKPEKVTVAKRPKAWTPDEDERLLTRVKEMSGSTIMDKCKLLAPEFKRSANSLYQHHWLLTSKKAKRKPRGKPGPKPKAKPEKIEKRTVETIPSEAPRTPMSTVSVCPTLALCQERVDQITAETICKESWQSCEHNQHLLLKKRPSEWA